MVHKGKWIKTDMWRGYYQPAFAVAGSSDTGTSSDSPAPSGEVMSELNDLKKFLKDKGINSQTRTNRSSNVFMVKRWVVVSPSDYGKAKNLADQYLKKHYSETSHIHEAD